MIYTLETSPSIQRPVQSVSGNIVWITYLVADLTPASYGWGGLLLLGWALTSVSPREAREAIEAIIRRLRR